MALQFRQKNNDNSPEDLQKEIKLLKDYNAALEKENDSRNEERKVLHAEIDRLLSIEKQWKSGTTVNINIKESKEYIEIHQQYIHIQQQYTEIKNKYDLLVIENYNLSTKNKPTENTESRITLLQKEKSALQVKVRNYEMKIYALEAEISKSQIEISQLKRKEEGSNALTQQFFSTQTRIDEYQRQLKIKNDQISKLQKEILSKEENHRVTIIQLNNKIEQLEINIKTKTTELSKYEHQTLSNNDSLLKQIVTLQTKNDDLQRQLTLKTSELSSFSQNQLKRQQQSSELILLQTKYDDLQKMVIIKNDDISNLNKIINKKDQELASLRLQLGNYANKINFLSDQLDKIQRTQKQPIYKETVKYVERETEETLLLRTKVDQVQNNNNALNNNINSLNLDIKNKNQYIKDLERRINILEDTNNNLEKELRIAIENRKNASRVTYVQQDQGLKDIIAALKTELQELRGYNQLVRQENDQLYAQLEMARSQQHCCPHGRPICREKSRSRSPITHSHSKKIVERIGNSSQSEVTFYQPTNETSSYLRAVQSTSPLSSNLYKSNTTSQISHDRYNDLQRKIKQLQSQNNVLKHQLVYEV